ncbi:MAG: M3 family metallopeptidase, partial [Phycisphaeraceae bacterium]
DQFQHWVYTHPDHDRAARTQQWLQICQRFQSREIQWTGLEPMHESMWHRQLHLFHHPFYYIEYGIAQLGALQMWAQYQTDSDAALGRYRRALSLGGTRKLPELFEAAGLRFDFSRATLEPLMQQLGKEIAKLPD